MLKVLLTIVLLILLAIVIATGNYLMVNGNGYSCFAISIICFGLLIAALKYL